MFRVGEALPETDVGMPHQLEALRVGAGGSDPGADGVHWCLYKIRSSFGSMPHGSAAQWAVGTLSAAGVAGGLDAMYFLLQGASVGAVDASAAVLKSAGM